jgi:hypothetical protein
VVRFRFSPPPRGSDHFRAEGPAARPGLLFAIAARLPPTEANGLVLLYGGGTDAGRAGLPPRDKALPIAAGLPPTESRGLPTSSGAEQTPVSHMRPDFRLRDRRVVPDRRGRNRRRSSRAAAARQGFARCITLTCGWTSAYRLERATRSLRGRNRRRAVTCGRTSAYRLERALHPLRGGTDAGPAELPPRNEASQGASP